ncbi:hypothetical protein K523DRAFT_299455 [Schizophyllum commune Tattone D]|nr:hypothetical protein K523DRAFT_299455 [Schizophyllum commune Tattone D]
MSDFEIDDEILALATESSKDKKRKRKQQQSDGSTKRRRHSDGTPESEDRSASPEPRKKRHASSDDEDEEEGEKYPLEGKYIDEEDREHLLGLPELERENILAQRLEEKQQKLDKAGLMAMFAQHQGGAVASAAKRQHTARGATKEKTRKLDELKAKRKEKDDRSKNKEFDRERSRSRSRSISDGSDMEMDSGDEQSDHEERRTERHRSEERSSYRDEEVTLADMWKIWLTRDMIVKHCYAPWFQDYAKGAWMRYLIGNENGMPVYRVCEVVDFEEVKKPYAIDGSKYIDFDVVLRHGDASKTWAMDKVSNSRPSDREFARAKIVWQKARLPFPTHDTIARKSEEMRRLVSKPVTEEDITYMTKRGRELKQRVFGNQLTGIELVSERARLEQALSLAEARRDFDEVDALQKQLAALAGPNGSSAPSSASRPAADTPPPSSSQNGGGGGGKQNAVDIVAMVNERNRRANAEAIRKAELAEQERRKAQKRANERHKGTPGVSRSATPAARVASAVATPEPVLPTVKPKAAMSVLDSIEVDLGDF